MMCAKCRCLSALLTVFCGNVMAQIQSPEIWFGPFDNLQRPGLGYIGPQDYPQLFIPGAPWMRAASKTAVFETQDYNILQMSDSDLKNMIATLAAWKMKLAVDINPITFDGTCGLSYAGFSGPGYIQDLVSRIQTAGGSWDIAAMDEPFWNASITTGPSLCPTGTICAPNGTGTGPGSNPCLWSVDKAASKVAETVAVLRKLLPNIVVGDMEPILDASNQAYSFPALAAQYGNWMDTYQKATGTPLAFFHVDVGWAYPDAFPHIQQVLNYAKMRQIPFGIMYDGMGGICSPEGCVSPASSSLQSMQWAEQNATQFELQTGYTPDHAVLISWDKFPDHVLPETDPGAHTYLIDRYARTRTHLGTTVAAQGIAGKLTDSQERPVVAAPIVLSLQDISSQGIFSKFARSGTVPALATTALVQICVNYCGFVGIDDMNIYSIQYADSGGQTNLDFSKGLTGWGVEANGTALVQLNSDANGKSLHISATAAQQIFINSVSFPVTPGSSYNLTVQARISPDSVGSGYFALIFFEATGKSSRDTLLFAPGTITLGSAQTSADGTYVLPSLSLPQTGTYQVQASYAGTDTLWPAFATTALGCSYALNLGGEAFPAQGGTGAFTITTSPGCPWTIRDIPPWVTITSATSGVGSSTVSFQAMANSGGDLSGSFTIAGQRYAVEEAASSIPGLVNVGFLGQLASEGTWTFSLDTINLGASDNQVRFSFSDDRGNPLPIPLTFPQTAAPTAPLLASTLDRTINANAQLLMESTGPDSASPLVGWGQLLTNGSISGFGIFSNPRFHWNAVVPLETRDARSYMLAFDNTGSLVTGVAVANVSTQAAAVGVIIRDDTGSQIGVATVNLAAKNHTSFMLNQQYQVTAGKRGTIEFDTPIGGQITVLGLRANGSALTTLPVLANVGTSGGSITHVTFNGGFASVFYLVNTGPMSAQFTLNFFDESGKLLNVPLLQPQSGAATITSALTKTLEAGAMLVVQTQAQDALPTVVGSAQLTTTGNISGFEVFRWTTFGQEASVPLETRAPNSFVLVFDDTNGLTTGVALANLSASPANITVNVRDDKGAALQRAVIDLAARGHVSFLLPTKYAVTRNLRGSAEFVVPTNTKISVIGLRAESDGTLTTIPVLIK